METEKSNHEKTTIQLGYGGYKDTGTVELYFDKVGDSRTLRSFLTGADYKIKFAGIDEGPRCLYAIFDLTRIDRLSGFRETQRVRLKDRLTLPLSYAATVVNEYDEFVSKGSSETLADLHFRGNDAALPGLGVVTYVKLWSGLDGLISDLINFVKRRRTTTAHASLFVGEGYLKTPMGQPESKEHPYLRVLKY